MTTTPSVPAPDGATGRPWQVVPANQAQSPFIVGDREGGSIADCAPPGPWMTFKEAAANAALIVAAVNAYDPSRDAAREKAMGEMRKALEMALINLADAKKNLSSIKLDGPEYATRQQVITSTIENVGYAAICAKAALASAKQAGG